jgi:hypothetical protein
MIIVKFQNACNGLLDSKQAKTFKEAAKLAVEMIEAAGELYSGDKIIVIGEEE